MRRRELLGTTCLAGAGALAAVTEAAALVSCPPVLDVGRKRR